jgi:pyrroloquinoline quinone (PQQ) biosynthesis protein C
MTFYQTLIKETALARQGLSSVPQLVDALQGKISRDTYIAYLTEAFHHVSHTVRFLMAMGEQLPLNKQSLQKAITEYISEEVGHEEWILNDIAAAGGDKESARQSTPNLETQLLIAYNYDYIRRKNPVGFFGMIFMLESTSIQLATQGADALRSNLGLPDSAFTYLYSHGELDISHIKIFENTVNTIIDKTDQDAIIEVAQNTFKLFANLLLAIPYKREASHAA